MKKQKNSQFLFRITCIVLMSTLVLSCTTNKPAAQTEEQEQAHEDHNAVELTDSQYKAVNITLGSAEMRALSGVLKVNGFIDVPPQNLVSVTTQMGGIIKSTPLLPGSVIKKGQIIAVLQNQEYVQLQQDYLESKSQLELTDAEYKRQLMLSAQNVNAQKTVQQAKAQYQSYLARVNALKQRLMLININPASLNAGNIRSEINIYAPITGYVTKVNVNTGKFVNPNDIMFEIVDNSNLHVELNVFEKDAAKVKSGQKVRFILTNDTTELKAVVELVGGEINADKTVTVHALAKGSKNFIPGTYLKAYIETGSNQVLALPVNAVVEFEGKKYIFIAADAEKTKDSAVKTHHFRLTEVTTGIIDGGFIEVKLPEQVEAANKIVLKGAYDLLSKMKNSEEE